MTDSDSPRRLLDSGHALSRRFLRAGRRDRLAPERASALAAGAIAAARAASAAGAAEAPRSAPTDPTSTTPPASKITAGTIVKVVVGVGLAAAVAFSFVRTEGPSADAPAQPPAAPTIAHDPVTDFTTIAVSDLPDAPTVAPTSKPAIAPLAESARAKVPASQESAGDTTSIEAELIALRHACSLLHEGNAQAAIAELADFPRRFPRGALLPEAEALAIDAELAAGRPARARALADAFLVKRANSPQALRVRLVRERLGEP